MKETRNLVLLTVDAWRADFCDRFDGMALLPALAEVARWAVRFESCYANGPWTTPPLMSILTGESPARHRVFYQWSAPRDDSPALAKRLGAAGYALPSICYLNGIHGYRNLGFATCEAPEAAHGPDDTLLAALRRSREGAAPFFLWYHYKYTHLPYWPGEPYRQRLGIDEGAVPQRLRESVCKEWVVPKDRFRFLPEDRELVRRLYAAGVMQFNDFLQRILEELQRGGLLERTTLVLTADHGDEHLEHGHIGHASTSEHATLHEEVLRIPLIVVDARIRGPRSIASRVQGMDLHSTLLSLVGIGGSPGPGAFDLSAAILDPGGALPAQDRTFYFHSARMGFRTPREREGHVIEAISDHGMKFVAERYDATRYLLYDLASDPEEQNPRIYAAEENDDRLLAAKARLMETRRMLAGG